MSIELPAGWAEHRLLDICRPTQWPTISREKFTENGYAVFGANGQIGFYSEFNHPDETIAITCRGATCGTINIVPPRSYITGNAMALDSLATDIIDQKYLYQALKYWGVAKSITGSAQPQITRQSLNFVAFPFPPLDEQRRIAEVLRSVDSAIAKNAVVISTSEKLIAMLATTIAEASGDPLCIEDLGTIVTGRTPSPSRGGVWSGTLPFITPGDLVEGVIIVEEVARHLRADAAHGGKLIPAGSVLVTCIGSTIGKTAIARTQCTTNQQINAVCCEPEISGYVYLACLALYAQIAANAGRQAVPIINKSTFSRLPVANRGRAEMIAISSLVDALDSQMQSSRAVLTMLNRLKEQLSAELLAGRMRVPA